MFMYAQKSLNPFILNLQIPDLSFYLKSLIIQNLNCNSQIEFYDLQQSLIEDTVVGFKTDFYLVTLNLFSGSMLEL